MPVLDVGVLRTWQYPASVVHEHTWAAESAEKFGQLTDLLFLAHVDSDMAGLPPFPLPPLRSPASRGFA